MGGNMGRAFFAKCIFPPGTWGTLFPQFPGGCKMPWGIGHFAALVQRKVDVAIQMMSFMLFRQLITVGVRSHCTSWIHLTAKVLILPKMDGWQPNRLILGRINGPCGQLYVPILCMAVAKGAVPNTSQSPKTLKSAHHHQV